MKISLRCIAIALGFSSSSLWAQEETVLSHDVNLPRPAWMDAAAAEEPLLAEPSPARHRLEGYESEILRTNRDDDDVRGVSFGVGPQAGYLRSKGGDDSTWFGGAQARLWLGQSLGAEAAITAHSDEFMDGDVRVTQYPVQASLLLAIFPTLSVRPYALAGPGWYYTRVDYDRSRFPAAEDKTEKIFGVHGGGGVEIDLGHSLTLNTDVRYIWLDADDLKDAAHGVDDRDFDNWMIAIGLTF